MCDQLRRRVSLGFTPERFPMGTHICLIYEDEEERRTVISGFLATGLEEGERLAYFADEMTQDEAPAAKIDELRQALDRIKTLRGIVPICASCKKIRDDQGCWNQVEGYVRDHTEAEFGHGICPECMKELCPGYKQDDDGSAPENEGGPQ